MSFSITNARCLLGKNVNLHMKDGSVIINVQLGQIQKGKLKKERFVTCAPYGGVNTLKVAFKSIAWAEMLSLNLIKVDNWA